MRSQFVRLKHQPTESILGQFSYLLKNAGVKKVDVHAVKRLLVLVGRFRKVQACALHLVNVMAGYPSWVALDFLDDLWLLVNSDETLPDYANVDDIDALAKRFGLEVFGAKMPAWTRQTVMNELLTKANQIRLRNKGL